MVLETTEKQLLNTMPRKFDSVDRSLQEWVKHEWELKVKRLQSFGITEDWELDQGVYIWLKEAKRCYVFGFYYACAFFSGVALELGMKTYMERLEGKKIDMKFYQVIECLRCKKILNEEEVQMAHELRQLRNEYGHGNISKLAKRAVKDNMKIKMSYCTITKNGLEEDTCKDIEIIETPKDREMELTFMEFHVPDVAWRSLVGLYKILQKLYPINTK